MKTFVIPAEHCLALFDTGAYASFVAADWTLSQLHTHFVDEMKRNSIIVWGTSAPANWRIVVCTERSERKGFRHFTARIRATDTHLHLTSDDELTVAAQFADVSLPRKGTERWAVTVTPGEYDCRVVQLFDPEEAESEAVFTQEEPHFAVEIIPATGKRPQAKQAVPWLLAK